MKRFTLDKLPLAVLRDLDVEDAFMASRVIIAAERFGVFRLLHKKHLSLNSAAAHLQLRRLPTEALLNSLNALGLLNKKGSLYSNTPLADKYFVKERSLYWTRQYSRECVETFHQFADLEKSLKAMGAAPTAKTGKKPAYVRQIEKDPARARDFTLMLYHLHRENASQLAAKLDLRDCHALLDVGGGSGVMSIALVKKHPRLKAAILDVKPVCAVADQIIKKAGLSKRISTIAGDINKEFPSGFDVILFSDLGPMTPAFLNAACRALPEGGLLVITDNFLSEDRKRPLEILLYRLLSPSSGWESCAEIIAALRKHGFFRIRRQSVNKTMTVITAHKC